MNSLLKPHQKDVVFDTDTIDEMNIRQKVDGMKVSAIFLLVGAATLFIFSSYMWHKYIYMSDRTIVWSAIENALSTDGVQVVTDDSTDTLLQRATSKLDYNEDLASETRSEFKDDSVDTIIRTISTLDRDYLYYERNINAKTPALQQLEGLWVDIGVPGQTESKTLADTFTNGALVLTGNLTSPDRKKLIKLMETDKLYTVMGLAKTEQIDGKEVRVYKVKLNSRAYNNVLQKYFEIIGLEQAASQIQPDEMEALEPIIEISVDVNARRIRATGYPNISSPGARAYSEWDTKYNFETPENAITGDELQKKVESIYTPTEQS